MRSSSVLLAAALSVTAVAVALGAGDSPPAPGPETTCKPQPDCRLLYTGQKPGAANGLQSLRPDNADHPTSNEGRER